MQVAFQKNPHKQDLSVNQLFFKAGFHFVVLTNLECSTPLEKLLNSNQLIDNRRMLPVTAAHACNVSALETEPRGLQPSLSGQPGLQHKFTAR